jgi:hypothetical protein
MIVDIVPARANKNSNGKRFTVVKVFSARAFNEGNFIVKRLWNKANKVLLVFPAFNCKNLIVITLPIAIHTSFIIFAFAKKSILIKQ